MGRRLKVPVFGIATPIRDTHGIVIGALVGGTILRQQNFLDNIQQNRYGESGGYIIAIPKDRLIVSANDKSRVMEVYPGPGVISLLDRFVQGYEGSVVAVNPYGVEVLFSAKSIPAAGWYMAVTLPTKEAFAPIKNMQRRMFLATFIFILLACGLVWWILRRLLLPMSETAALLASLPNSRQFPQLLTISRKDEIGDLIGGFNHLLQILAKQKRFLQESEERYRTLVEWTPEAFVVHRNGIFLYANQAAIRLFGASSELDLIGQSYFDRIHPDYHQIVQDRIRKISNDGIVAPVMEEQFIKLDGSIFYAEAQGITIAYDGEPAVHVALRDTTERRRGEMELKKTQYFLNETAAIGRVGGWEFHIDMGKLTWTHEVYKIHEVDLDFDLSIEKAINFCTPDCKPGIEKAIRQATEFGQPFEMDLEIVTAKGNLRAVHAIGKVDNEQRRVYGFFQDITERKRAEEKLVSREECLKTIFNTLAEGVALNEMVFDAAGNAIDYKVLEVNPAYYQVADYATGITVIGGMATSLYGMDEKVIKSFYDGHKDVAKSTVYEFISPISKKHFSVTTSPFANNQFVTSFRDVTEQRKVEKMLIARELEFRTLADNAPDNIARFDRDARLVYANPQLEATIGVPVSERLGKTPNEAAPDGRNKDLEINVKGVIASGKYREFQMTLPDRGEGVRYHQLHMTPEWDDSGQVSGVLVIGRDITESKRLVIALNNEIKKNYSLLIYASDGIHILDNEGNLLEFSDSFCRMLGYGRVEMQGMNVSQWDVQVPIDELPKVVNRRIEQGFRDQFETRHQCKDKSIIDVEISSVMIEIDGKKALYCCSRDITERKQSEIVKQELSDQIRIYAETISDLYDQAPCGYHSLDSNGQFVHINETELKWLGYTRYEIVGKLRFSDLLPPQLAMGFAEEFSDFKRVGKEQDKEFFLICKDGSSLPVMISSLAEYDENGKFVKSRSTVYDMTERIKMEMERLSNMSRLKELSLHLVATQEEARRQLSSELHDLTSPNLAAIGINLEIISNKLPRRRSSDLSSRLEDTRALILDTAASIREIGADLRPPLLDYAGLPAALESHLQIYMKRTGIQVEFICKDHDKRYNPELESMLFRIIQEALTNCAKHSRARFIRISLCNSFDFINLTICDDGIGFNSASMGKSGNIGLGVLNMREMSEILGGRFAFDSELGVGTTIEVKIPLNEY